MKNKKQSRNLSEKTLYDHGKVEDDFQKCTAIFFFKVKQVISMTTPSSTHNTI